MDILSNLLVSRRGRFLGGQNCSAWRAKNSGGRVYRPSSGTTTRTRTRTRTRTGLKYLRSRRDNAHAGADLSPPPPSIPRYLVEPYRHAAAKMRGRACLPVTV